MKINPKKCIQKNAHFLIKDALFSCRSADLPENTLKISPENTSKISRGIQWKISRHSLENIENISWHSMENIKAIIGTYRKERKRGEREKKRRNKGNPIENINGI